MAESPETRDTIVRLLSNIANRREVDEYLKRFSALESTRFAAILVPAGLIRTSLDEIASALAFLQRVGLTPVVLHGVPKTYGALRAAEVDVDDARRQIHADSLSLLSALDALGARARPVLGGAFEYAGESESAGGLEVHREPLVAGAQAGHLPIVGALAAAPGGRLLPVEPMRALDALVGALAPDKIIVLDAGGGLAGPDGRIVPSINLAEDRERLSAASWAAEADRERVFSLAGLLGGLPRESSVSVAHPAKLARELFTHSGSGTLLRKGERVFCHEGTAGWERGRVRDLLEACFGRELVPGYFDSRVFERVYVSESYRATAILTSEGVGGVPYLDKFGVTQKAQGEGLGRSTWLRMRRDNPALFWRSRAANPINSWYFQQADGSARRGSWVVFWYGLTNWAAIEAAVSRAETMPASLASAQAPAESPTETS